MSGKIYVFFVVGAITNLERNITGWNGILSGLTDTLVAQSFFCQDLLQDQYWC